MTCGHDDSTINIVMGIIIIIIHLLKAVLTVLCDVAEFERWQHCCWRQICAARQLNSQNSVLSATPG